MPDNLKRVLRVLEKAQRCELATDSEARRQAQATCRMLLDDLFDSVRRCDEVWPYTEREPL